MVKAKTEEKKKAREYRKQGKSMTWIARELNVSIGSVSLWTHDIILSDEQYEYLQNSDARKAAQKKAAEANVIVHRNKRLKYQEEGRAKAREGDLLHQGGCMLYWGEGSKSRNSLSLANSDIEMMVYYMRFLREALNAKEKNIKFCVNAYSDNGLSEDDIINFWLDTLQLTRSNLKTCSFNKQPSSSKQTRDKLLYGVGEVAVHSTRLVQHVYGAIQEYANIEQPEWLDL